MYSNEAGNNLFITKLDQELLVDVLPLDDLSANEGERSIKLSEFTGEMVLLPGKVLNRIHISFLCG